jgi:nucleotide-binding universal stress UspA family protein
VRPRLTTPAANWDVLHGRHPTDAIVGYCRDHPGTLPALAGHGRTGRDLAVHGSVALAVTHRSPVPLVVVTPGWSPS